MTPEPPVVRPRAGRRRGLWAVVVVVAVAALATGTFALVRRDRSAHSKVVSMAAAASIDAGTFRVAGQFRAFAPGQSVRPDELGSIEGVVDLVHHASDITSELAVAEGGPSARSRQISIGSDSWTSLGGSSFPTVPPKTWVRVPSREPAPDRPGYFGFNPTTLLEQLKTTSSIRLVGTEVVRGTQTDHYEVGIRLSGLAAQRYSDVRQEVWVGSDGLVRRVKSTADLKDADGPSGPASQTSLIITDFYDFGVPVDIRPPPADQILDVPGPP